MECFGVFVLLFLVGVVGIVMLTLLPHRARRVILHVAALFLVALLLVVLFRALAHAHLTPPAWLVCFFLLVALCWLLVWGLARLVRTAPAAARPAACPPIGRLRDLLAERLTPREHARVAAHLEGCAACQHRVEGLTAGKESLVGIARNLSRQPATPPALRRVMDSLKGQEKQEETAAPAFAADLPLGFLSPPDKPGQLGRLERYEVLEEIGRGGMGVVLKAFDPSLHRVVAIKVLAPQLATSGVARKRFLREAKAAAAVTHDHIVTIHAVEEANGLPYLVMQYVPGLSLQDRIDKEGPLSDLTEVLRIGMQTASGLAAAHAQGIVHRDVKPANILLEEGVGRVKITDFGLARAMDDASLTQSGLVAGSPLYMAPEQARGETLDHRADLFSLGSVLYTACTGRPPFRAANTLAVLRRVTEDTPRAIRETNPEVPDWLVAVVEKLMAKDPADRYQSAGEVVEVLGRHLAEFHNGAAVPAPSPAPKAAPAGLPTSVTICPSCGANLDVPDRMLGQVVHCGECGKPFRPEEGSEVLLVARPAPSPFGHPARVNRPKPKMAAGCLAVLAGLGFFLILITVTYSIRQADGPPAVPVMATTAPVPVPTPRPPVPAFWKETLAWFPAEATLFGAVNLQAFGSLNLGDEWTQAAIRLALPAGAEPALTPENLGRVRIDRVSLAYYEGPKSEDPRALVQLEGLALDGRRRALDFIRRAGPDTVRIDELARGGSGGNLARVACPGLPWAIGLYDDHRMFLTRSMSKGAKEAEHLKALELLRWFDRSNTRRAEGDLLTGYSPPWLQMALGAIPPDACGLLLGEIPPEWRKLLTAGLGLRACPRTFACHLRREGDGVVLSLTLNLDKPGAERALAEDLEKARRQMFDALQARLPAVRGEPEALARVRQALKARWEVNAGGGSVRGRVQLSGSTWRALGKLVKRASRQAPEEGHAEP